MNDSELTAREYCAECGARVEAPAVEGAVARCSGCGDLLVLLHMTPPGRRPGFAFLSRLRYPEAFAAFADGLGAAHGRTLH